MGCTLSWGLGVAVRTGQGPTLRPNPVGQMDAPLTPLEHLRAHTGHFQMLKAVKETYRRLGWGVMAGPASARALDREEVRPGERASRVPKGRGSGVEGG